jgi:peptidoglycan/LPS O-acetylase OafA/YrhL
MRRADAHYLPSLDGLRAVSILLVVLGHAFSMTAPSGWRPLTYVFDGGLGVRIFFVISGFLITTLLLREQAEAGAISLPRFYVRRFLRLAPVQLAYIGALFLLTLTTPLQVSTCEFATSLTYTKNYGCGTWVDGHLWSLAVEEQFYLIWPTLLALLPRRPLIVVLAALACISPISRALEYHSGHRTLTWLTSNTDVLMIGCLMAFSAHSPLMTRLIGWRPAVGRLMAVGLIAAPMVMSAHYWLGWFTVMFGPALQAAAAAYLICSLVFAPKGWSVAVLNAPPVAFLGRMSYSLYVWQQLFFTSATAFGLTWALPLEFPFNVGFALLAGLASYLIIETPMAKLRARFRSRHRPVQTDRLVLDGG